ncbi:response regulator transcription factor [Fulvivirga sp. M361]|uniref:LytR/AlgR family response regulator transcription factor n=1 Tax=Fulvivirga sp. M361 TaxID=2594266 RepID=UPI00117AB736|nr:LytTR family DNA-binding domain-containing protein [Fulvivirga sp. M361]TRX60467.1 response regulator transcription factor [Fulvivirga sp. M361]
MRTVIIEDEYPAAERLQELVELVAPESDVVAILGSVTAANQWFETHPMPDLIFSDIQLSDGLVFEVLEKNSIKTPVIFTTSFDQYAIRAFKLNGMDYLLKPIKQVELRTAIEKYKTLRPDFSLQDQFFRMQDLIENFRQDGKKQYKDRFLVKYNDQLLKVRTEEIAYFYTTNEMVLLQKYDGGQYLIDYTLEELEGNLDPTVFFRLNRQLMVHLDAIQAIHLYFNKRLKVELNPAFNEEVIISKAKSPAFKRWLDGKHYE